MANKLRTNSIDQDNYIFSISHIINEDIERVWPFLRNPLYFKEILPSQFVNFKLKQKTSSFCPGDEFSFYWTGVSNISTKFISIIDSPNIKKLVSDISMNIGIYYRKTYNLYKITNDNTTLLKIVLSKMPNKDCDSANFISFTKLNPDLYSSTLYNLNKILSDSWKYLFQLESFVIDKNHLYSWDNITNFKKLSNLNQNLGTNFCFQGEHYKVGSFIKCYVPKRNQNVFMRIKNVNKKKKNNKWIYAMETFGADISYIKQEIQICVIKINENKTQISVIHIFKQVLPKDYWDNFSQNKKKVMKKIKKFLLSSKE